VYRSNKPLGVKNDEQDQCHLGRTGERSVYGEAKKALTEPTKYYGSKYYDAAHRD
jgi:hypothetical protein